jgi:H+/Cl- antiporter ClcA
MDTPIEIEEVEIIEQPEESWMPKVLLLGAVVGALTGLLGAYLLIQRARKTEAAPQLSAGEGVKLGVLVFGLLRQVSQLGAGEEK